MRQKSTLAESVTSRLEKKILEGRYLPGDRLREDVISREYGASRTPVREAFKHLAASGLIAVKPHQGAVVRKLEIGELAEMFQVMAELEGVCARLAAKRLRIDQKRNLELAHKECARLARSGQHEEFYQANNVYHKLIHRISGNSFLLQETENLAQRLDPYRRQITFHPGRMIESIQEHDTVMRAIFAGDGETAAATMRSHVNILGDAFDDYLKVLSTQPQKKAKRGKRLLRPKEKAQQQMTIAT